MRIIIEPESMPAVKGRFSQAIRSDPFVFLAGLIASDFETGLHPNVQMNPGFPYYGIPIKRQTEFTLNLLNNVARGAGTTIDRAAHLWSLLTDVHEFALAQEAGRELFDPVAPPAESTYGVHELAAAGARIEMDAVLAGERFEREIIRSHGLPEPPSEFGLSPAVKVGPFAFVSSQAATDYRAGISPEAAVDPGFPHFASSVKRQAEYILRNMDTLLAE